MRWQRPHALQQLEAVLGRLVYGGVCRLQLRPPGHTRCCKLLGVTQNPGCGCWENTYNKPHTWASLVPQWPKGTAHDGWCPTPCWCRRSARTMQGIQLSVSGDHPGAWWSHPPQGACVHPQEQGHPGTVQLTSTSRLAAPSSVGGSLSPGSL